MPYINTRDPNLAKQIAYEAYARTHDIRPEQSKYQWRKHAVYALLTLPLIPLSLAFANKAAQEHAELCEAKKTSQFLFRHLRDMGMYGVNTDIDLAETVNVAIRSIGHADGSYKMPALREAAMLGAVEIFTERNEAQRELFYRICRIRDLYIHYQTHELGWNVNFRASSWLREGDRSNRNSAREIARLNPDTDYYGDGMLASGEVAPMHLWTMQYFPAEWRPDHLRHLSVTPVDEAEIRLHIHRPPAAVINHAEERPVDQATQEAENSEYPGAPPEYRLALDLATLPVPNRFVEAPPAYEDLPPPYEPVTQS
jgi:hypothetical protein